MKSGYANVSKLRRTLKRIEPEATRAVKLTIEKAAQAIEADAMMNVPVDEGDLARSIAYKIGGDGFSAVIGPGAGRAIVRSKGLGRKAAKFTKSGRLSAATIKDKSAQFQLAKGIWVEFGTKGGGGVGPQPARPFMQPAFDANKGWVLSDLKKGIANALSIATAGSDE